MIISEVNQQTCNVISDLNVSAWERELQNDCDKEYILQGVSEGFKVVDHCDVEIPAELKNHMSATNHKMYEKVNKQIQYEIDHGHYVKISHKPLIVSPLAAIEKADGSVRIIHDASRPVGNSLNDLVLYLPHQSYQSVQDAIQLIKPGSFCTKIDLKSAYRSVGLHPSQYPLCGLKWKFEGDLQESYLIDTRLMMGSKMAPGIFHRLSQAVKRFMERRGYHVIAYLDDFLIVEDTYILCLQAQHVLIKLLRNLGFSIAWKKVDGPAQTIVFLGVEIDCKLLTIGLPDDKVCDLKLLLNSFIHRKRASCRQLQSLAGKLNWASQVIRGGRSYLRAILDSFGSLQKQNHKARLSQEFMDDIHWWLNILNVFPGKYLLYKPNCHIVCLDASNSGGGFVYGNDWGYVNWQIDFPDVSNCHINTKETVTAVLAARRWASLWTDSQVVFCTDNITARSCIQNGTGKTPVIMPWLRELHYYASRFNFDILSIWIPGKENVVPDIISRLDSDYFMCRFFRVLNMYLFVDIFLCICNMYCHMSLETLFFLFNRNYPP